jgi:hypothetical protein
MMMTPRDKWFVERASLAPLDVMRDGLAMLVEIAVDDEAAHAFEDDLRQYALAHISLAHPDSQRIAALALATSDVNFSRWCA